MDKLIPALIVIGIIILGFIMKLVELSDITKRINFTTINEQIQKNAQTYATNANTSASGICFLPH